MGKERTGLFFYFAFIYFLNILCYTWIYFAYFQLVFFVFFMQSLLLSLSLFVSPLVRCVGNDISIYTLCENELITI